MSNHICTCAALFFRKGGSSWDGIGSASAAPKNRKGWYVLYRPIVAFYKADLLRNYIIQMLIF